MASCSNFERSTNLKLNVAISICYINLLTICALARRLRHTLRAPPCRRGCEIGGGSSARGSRHMDFGRISRRHLLQGSAAMALGGTLNGPFGAGRAFAADTTTGFIYLGSRDDYGYQQA